MEVTLTTQIPPIYAKCKEKFGVTWDQGVIFAYGDKIHSKYAITDDLIAHELTHIERQAEIGAKEWWDRYLTDRKFRLNEEVLAYRNQLQYCYANYDVETINNIRDRIIYAMTTIYGNMCTKEQAKLLLKSY